MIKNNQYKQLELKPDPVMEKVAEKILPFVREVESQWGNFKPSIVRRQSTALPKAYLTRFGFNEVKDTSGNGQHVVTNYAIAIVMKDNPKDGDIQAIALENSIIQSLQNLTMQGRSIQKLKSSDLTTEEINRNGLRVFTIAFQMAFVFEPQDTVLSRMLNKGSDHG